MDKMYEKMNRGLSRLAGRRSPMVESEDGADEKFDIDILRPIACDMLAYANEFHVYHWNARNNFEHELMGEVYDLFRDTADRLAERYMSLTDAGSFVPDDNFGCDRKDWSPSKDDILARMESILKGVDDAVADNGGIAYYGGICNIFSDFDEKMGTLIYKYSRFEG